MNRNTALLIVIVMSLTGCQSSISALDQAGTMVAETIAAAPTERPLSTSTPMPIDTPEPFPTVTPNPAWTTTVEAMSVLSELDARVGPGGAVPYEAGELAWKQSEPVTINMSGPQKDAGILQPVTETIHAANFIFKSKVTWNASGVLVCGLAFRAEDDLVKGKQYQFYFYRFSGLPAYAIAVYDFGRFKNTISDLKYSDGVNDKNGGSNEFVLIAQDEKFTVYINEKRQGEFHDSSKQLSDGRLAFLAWQGSGKGSCQFEDSWLWIVE